MDAAEGGERLHPGYSNLRCTACRHLGKADDGGSLGSSPSWWGEFAGVRQPVSYHLGCPLVILHSSTQLAERELGIGHAGLSQQSKITRRDIRIGWQQRGRMHSEGVSLESYKDPPLLSAV